MKIQHRGRENKLIDIWWHHIPKTVEILTSGAIIISKQMAHRSFIINFRFETPIFNIWVTAKRFMIFGHVSNCKLIFIHHVQNTNTLLKNRPSNEVLASGQSSSRELNSGSPIGRLCEIEVATPNFS